MDGCLYDSDRELIQTRPLDESIIERNDDMYSDELDTNASDKVSSNI